MKYDVKLLQGAVDFILSLPQKMQAKVQRTIELLSEFGYQLPEPHSKVLKGYDGLKELRIKQGSNICRLFYFHYHGSVYIVTSGYIKKEDKTKQSEIDKAMNLMKLVKENKNENN